MAVRIKDIAKLANCSEATVSLALNGSTLVNENTRKTILETAKKAGTCDVHKTMKEEDIPERFRAHRAKVVMDD